MAVGSTKTLGWLMSCGPNNTPPLFWDACLKVKRQLGHIDKKIMVSLTTSRMFTSSAYMLIGEVETAWKDW